MTKEQLNNELTYLTTMHFVKQMLDDGLITKDEYTIINEKMKQKYHPINSALSCEIDLI